MASRSIRRFDTQAKVSSVVSLIAMVGVLAMAGLSLRNLDPELRVIRFNPEGFYRPAFLGICAATMFLAVIGLGLGLNSAGQRRNELQKRSWIGFFMGTAAFSMAIVLFWMFHKLKLPV